jgi:hypothetical protein
MRSTFILRALGIVAAVLLLTSCDILGLTAGASGRRTELARQRAKWNQQQITSYRLTYQRYCFCGTDLSTPVEIEVRSGVVVMARYAESDAAFPSDMQSRLPTVETLCAIVGDAIDRDPDLLEVTYDASRGFPRRIAVDYRFDTADDEFTHTVLSLDIILPPMSP